MHNWGRRGGFVTKPPPLRSLLITLRFSRTRRPLISSRNNTRTDACSLPRGATPYPLIIPPLSGAFVVASAKRTNGRINYTLSYSFFRFLITLQKLIIGLIISHAMIAIYDIFNETHESSLYNLVKIFNTLYEKFLFYI